MSSDAYLDCTIIQQAQILLKVNPLIEGFQRTTLGPCRNFSIITSEFVQILHTGSFHWVCISPIGCLPGEVRLYNSIYHDTIEMEVHDQVENMTADSFTGITSVPVQQQRNGSDYGIFTIALAACLVYRHKPEDFTFDIARMRPHLLQCLKDGTTTMFPSF